MDLDINFFLEVHYLLLSFESAHKKSTCLVATSKVNNNMSSLECELCEQRFITNQALKTHNKLIHLSDTLKCHICDRVFKDVYGHIKNAHGQRKYECTHCEKKFQTKPILNDHIQSIHFGLKANCPDCGKNVSLSNLTRHINEFHKKMKKPCIHCGKEFGESNLPRHIRSVHNNEGVICPDCGKAFGLGNLRKHILDVHEKRKKICDVCNKEVTYANISHHKRKEHGIGKPILNLRGLQGPKFKSSPIKRELDIVTNVSETSSDCDTDGNPSFNELDNNPSTNTIMVGNTAFTVGDISINNFNLTTISTNMNNF